MFANRAARTTLQVVSVVGLMLAMTLCSFAAGGPAAMKLSDSWTLQSSCVDKAGGEQISSAGYKASGWHRASVPSTVLAALVADGTYPDPYFGTNIRNLPGMSYKVGENFVHAPMADDSPFKCSWWFRKEFTAPAGGGKHSALRLTSFSRLTERKLETWLCARWP